MAENGSGLAVFGLVKGRFQWLLDGFEDAGLGSEDHAAGFVGQEAEDPGGDSELVIVVEEVEEHVYCNHVGLTGAEIRHQRSLDKAIVGCEDIVGEEVVGGESVAVAPELVGEIFIFREEVGGVEVVGWGAVEDAFAKILAEAGAQVEEGISGFQTGKDHGVVERVFGETETQEPEFAYAGPGEDTPGFVSLCLPY